MYLLKKGNKVVLSGNIHARYGNALAGVDPSDLVTKEQLDTAVNSTLEGNNNDFTGNNTHSGTETFSNATGVTTNILTPRTSGAGTSLLRPSGVFTTTGQVLTSAMSGGTYGLSKADGLTVALPTITADTVGMWFDFVILTSCTSVGYIISSQTGDTMVGNIYGTIAHPDAANDAQFNIAGSTNNTLTLGATTACGLAGGTFRCTAISATQWAFNGVVLGSGTISSTLFTTV